MEGLKEATQDVLSGLTPREAKVLRGLPLGLTESAVDAVRKWKFKPSTLNGKPVEVLYILTVRFNLQ